MHEFYMSADEFVGRNVFEEHRRRDIPNVTRVARGVGVCDELIPLRQPGVAEDVGGCVEGIESTTRKERMPTRLNVIRRK